MIETSIIYVGCNVHILKKKNSSVPQKEECWFAGQKNKVATWKITSFFSLKVVVFELWMRTHLLDKLVISNSRDHETKDER